MSLLNRYPQMFERLFRALGIRGPLPDSIAWESQLGVQLLDLSRPEYSWLWRETRYVASLQQAASVGNNSVVIIANQGSQLVTIDRLRVSNRNAGSLLFGMNTDTATAGGALSRVMGLDTRQDISTTAPPRPQVTLFANAAVVALPATSPSWQINTGVDVDVFTPDFPCILRPGTTLWVQTQAVNTALDVSVWWRERAPSDSELS